MLLLGTCFSILKIEKVVIFRIQNSAIRTLFLSSFFLFFVFVFFSFFNLKAPNLIMGLIFDIIPQYDINQ